MIVIIFDGEGGELCLHEPGIVLNLRNGDVVLFPSLSITHFNLNHNGRRASLVFHSDKSDSGWLKDCNGWKHNIYFRETTSDSYSI